ncbi:MAG TPA: hypothetical protein VHZ98_10380 [Galbitalea sp.]|jgi:hypothetical protein|nr:hypothetical protein [Galbitalea sp.]
MSGLGDLVPLGHSNPLGSGLVRQTNRQLGVIASEAQFIDARNDAAAFVTYGAMNNIASLIATAMPIVEANPAAASYIEPLLSAYANGATMRIAQGFR